MYERGLLRAARSAEMGLPLTPDQLTNNEGARLEKEYDKGEERSRNRKRSTDRVPSGESPESSADCRGSGNGRVSSSLGGSPESGGEENGGAKRLQPGTDDPDRHRSTVRSHAESPGPLSKWSGLSLVPDSSVYPENPEPGRVDPSSLPEGSVHGADARGSGGSRGRGGPGILPGSGLPIEGQMDEGVRRVSQTSP